VFLRTCAALHVSACPAAQQCDIILSMVRRSSSHDSVAATSRYRAVLVLLGVARSWFFLQVGARCVANQSVASRDCLLLLTIVGSWYGPYRWIRADVFQKGNVCVLVFDGDERICSCCALWKFSGYKCYACQKTCT